MSAPHENGSLPVTLRRGGFWIAGDLIRTEFGTFQRAPLWVEWEAPAEVTRPFPLVLVHGGGGQGTDWKVTPDGRPGWVDRFVAEGFAVYVVDRPGHGRSPHHPAVLGEPGGQGPVEMTVGVFAAPALAEAQTQWPWRRDEDGTEVQQLSASSGFMLADLAEAQTLDARRLAELLDLTGPAVLVTHSAGAPGGWLAADARPGLVRGIVAIEPMGPPFLDAPGLGALVWGVTAAPLTTVPPFDAPDQLAESSTWTAPALADLPVAVVTGQASPFAASAPPVVDFLNAAGAAAVHLPLEASGIMGNGHGLMFEANSDETVRPVIEWIAGLG
jgi:pimeloyl-ACP methyl ester carboxylesterase